MLATKQLGLQQKTGILRVLQYSLTCTEIKPRNDLEDYKNTDNKKRRQHASVFFWSLNCDNMIAVLRPAFRKNTGIIQSVQSAHTHQYIRVVPVPKRTVRFKSNQHPLVIRVIRSLTRSTVQILLHLSYYPCNLT